MSYGKYWENRPEIIAMCTACRRRECVGKEGCREMREAVARLRLATPPGKRAPRGRVVCVAGEARTIDGWARRLGVGANALRRSIRRAERRGGEAEAVIWARLRGVSKGPLV